MRIDWYMESGDDDGSDHYATTEGELPREGSTVYFRDEKMRQTHGVVTLAHHCLGKGEVDIDRIGFPSDMPAMERMDFAARWIEREFGGVMQTLIMSNHTIAYATQRGEVVVKLAPPLGAPEKKE